MDNAAPKSLDDAKHVVSRRRWLVSGPNNAERWRSKGVVLVLRTCSNRGTQSPIDAFRVAKLVRNNEGDDPTVRVSIFGEFWLMVRYPLGGEIRKGPERASRVLASLSHRGFCLSAGLDRQSRGGRNCESSLGEVEMAWEVLVRRFWSSQSAGRSQFEERTVRGSV